MVRTHAVEATITRPLGCKAVVVAEQWKPFRGAGATQQQTALAALARAKTVSRRRYNPTRHSNAHGDADS